MRSIHSFVGAANTKVATRASSTSVAVLGTNAVMRERERIGQCHE